MKSIAAVLLVLGICAGGSLAVRADGPRLSPELIVDVDVNDEVWLRDHKMTEGDIKTLVGQLKTNGCQTLIVRCGCLGFLPYKTALSYPFGFDAKHARANPAPAIIPDMEAEIVQSTAWNKRYAEVIREINPPAAFIRAGHEQGMKVLAWIDIFDDGWPGYRSKFLDEHPYCQWVGKDGKTYFKGLTDYAWPEARAFRVKQAVELLDLGADGIHCSTSAHCRHLPNTREIDFYGYSQPIVEAFRKKYGVDIRTAKQFDNAAWQDLKGDAMVQLYRDLAKLCHGRGKELWIGMQLGATPSSRRPTLATLPWPGTATTGRRWSANGWPTPLSLGITNPCPPPAINTGQERPTSAARVAKTCMPGRREYQSYCKGKTRLYLFSEWMPGKPQELDARLHLWSDVTCKNGFDGIDMHEAWNFECSPANMALLGSMAERLRGKTPAR